MLSKRSIQVLLVIIIILASATFIIVPKVFSKSGIEIRFYYTPKASTSSFRINSLASYVIYYQVLANSRDEGLIEIARGKTSSSRILIEPGEKLKRICEDWLKPPYGNNNLIGIEVDVWILDKTSGELIGPVIKYKLIDPAKIINGGLEVISVEVNKSSTEETMKETTRVVPKEGDIIEAYWKLEKRITPEDLARELSFKGLNDWIKWNNGLVYIKTPILLVENKRNDLKLGAHVTITCDIGVQEKTTIEGSLGIGSKVLEEISKGKTLPELGITLYKGVRTISKKAAGGGITSYLLPGERCYVYIWTRPYFEYYCWYVDGYPMEREMFKSYVSDFLMKDYNTILVEYSKGDIPKTVENIIIGSTELKEYEELLEVGEHVNSWEIIGVTYDTSTVGSFDFGTLVSAVISVVAYSIDPALGIIASAVPISVTYSLDATIGSIFTIANNGDGGIIDGTPDPGCMNYSVSIFYATTTLEYRKDPPWWAFWKGPYYYRIPVGKIAIKPKTS